MVDLIVVYAGLVLLWPLLRALEPRATRHFDHQRRIDAAWWLISPLGTGTLTRAVTLGAYGLLGFAAHRTPTAGFALFGAAARLRALPPPLQLLFGLLLADGIGYWSHRLRHRWLWRFHRIHHAPRELVALSAARMHPLDELIDGFVIGLALLVCGFDWWVFGLVGPINLVYTLLSHADLTTDFGPLRALLVSPRMHRWHHARRYGPRGVNYAGLFPVWDLAFGTYHLPAESADELGVDGAVPDSLGGQLVQPFLDGRA